ncbi:AaceriABL134Cp [[Ashbya] aceris (nom. inval.)]|nr:AaceriABL134Cp [[Ashbya] aceris (nom. inval.)]
MSDEESATATKVDLQAKALSDPTKKRKADDEIEIDLTQPVPLSKKQKRLLRRGKITLEQLSEKFNIDKKSIEEYKNEQKGQAEDGEAEPAAEEETKPAPRKEKKFGVWIGNMAFDTTQDELRRFIVSKTAGLEAGEVTDKDIVRVNMPLAKNDGKQVKNKGFAYVDFATSAQMDAVIALSEAQLNGRNLLIKNAKSYDGRPAKNDLISMSKNPPSRILFVGNLSFDTTDELLKKHFQHCGEIVKIRMATFQDSGKCKGFAFVDFRDEAGATAALTDRACRSIAGRPLRMEYGEDRSKRHVRSRPVPSLTEAEPHVPAPADPAPAPAPAPRAPRPRKPTRNDHAGRPKSSVALATAQRASAAIVPSQGKKVKFD